MKSLIRKILREDFDWVTDVPSYEDMSIDWVDHVVPYLTGKKPVYDEETEEYLDYEDWDPISPNEQEDLEPMAKHYFIKELNDVEFKDGKILMSVSHWQELAPLFKDCDYSGYICKHTAESILSEEDHWEPYYDVVYDWKDQVWESLNDENIKLIVEHMKKHCIGDVIEYMDGEVELTESLLDSWSKNADKLGDIINNNDGGCFEDMKNSLRWWYEDGYNTAARDEYWSSAHDAITSVFGEGKWEEYEGKDRQGNPMTRHNLVFDVSDIFMDAIQAYFDDYCDLSYDYECELQYSSFLDNLVFIMNEELYSELLNPRVSEWPDSNKVDVYFNERASEEL